MPITTWADNVCLIAAIVCFGVAAFGPLLATPPRIRWEWLGVALVVASGLV